MAARQKFVAKHIVLFSDGTGNSSSKSLKTNVWRMYQASDLGMPGISDGAAPSPNGSIQIGRYDDGVGTSSFRPSAMLGGIFGWGLQRNVLSLYLFLCRNYRQASANPTAARDSIYAFGFSRGAFTIRVLADLIDKQGLIAHDADDDIEGLCREAYRAYRASSRPKMPPMRWLVPVYKASARWAVATWRRVLGRKTLASGTVKRFYPDVTFLGVWDTVSAYGGPIAELVRAWDEWIIPIKLTDTRLPPAVKCARHALALDDERDAFQPIPWDETHIGADQDLRQVWFAGMHADVGGGYPDDGLAYVSLVWMLDEAKAAGLRIHAWEEQEIRRQADSFGRMHDSRAGLGGYYRYQPRDIGAFFRPPAPGTKLIRDADRPDDEGLRLPVLVHESVFVRMKSGTDAYSPINIPRRFEIVRDLSAPASALNATCHKRLADAEANRRRADSQKKVWDGVWVRRVQYFSIVLFSLLLASMPLWHGVRDMSEYGIGALVRGPLRWIGAHSPWYAAAWPAAFAMRPWWALGFAACIFALFSWGAGVERKLRHAMWQMWRDQFAGKPVPAYSAGWIRRLRMSRPYGTIAATLKWHTLPFVMGASILALFGIVLVGMLAQSASSYNELNKLACAHPSGKGPTYFSTASRCNDTGLELVPKQSYFVQFSDLRWGDPAHHAPPEGLKAGRALSLGLDRLLIGFRPVMSARWLQPLIRVTPPPGGGAPYIAPLILARSPRGDYFEARFRAPESGGRLSFFANDMIAPWPLAIGHFYRKDNNWPINRGHRWQACVAVLVDPGALETERKALTQCPQATPRTNVGPQ